MPGQAAQSSASNLVHCLVSHVKASAARRPLGSMGAKQVYNTGVKKHANDRKCLHTRPFKRPFLRKNIRKYRDHWDSYPF